VSSSGIGQAVADVVEARGPYFDELRPGQVFAGAPAVTLTEGLAAVHRSIVGGRLRYVTDHEAGTRLTGRGPLAHPALVWDTVIGQSTEVTHFVRANLFYRGLRFSSFPVLGDTLHTTTTVVGLRENARRPGRPATGLAALRIESVDQRGVGVLDFHRCAMLRLGPSASPTGHDDDMSSAGFEEGTAVADAVTAVDGLRLEQHRRLTSTPEVGTVIDVVGGDVVSSAPELARLTLNVARVHHDRASSGRRLVYGGHTIGVAASHVVRVFPDLITFLGWESCDHMGPVHEGDTLRSRVEVVHSCPGPGSTVVVRLRVRVTAEPAGDVPGSDEAVEVLDWRCEVLA
jgi:acyl dehydratase